MLFRSATNTSSSLLSRGDRRDEDVVGNTSVMHRGNTRSVSFDGAGGSSRGPVRPWHDEDVVLFLSKDGDSDPIYLWRERPAAPAPPGATPGGAGAAGLSRHK